MHRAASAVGSATSVQNLLASLSGYLGNAGSRDNASLSSIKAIRTRLADLDDDQLRAESLRLRERTISSGGRLVDVASGLALLDESTHRTIGIRLYDVQMISGLSLLRNEIAEMKTGEGKTLVGALVSYVRALQGRGVHFMTTNAYLAERDSALARPIFQKLGMTVGLLQREQGPQEKRVCYECDVTYGPGYEFGFDYLRDQLALIQQRETGLGQQLQSNQRGQARRIAFSMQRGHYCAIVDEADSVLIDEATTPLILSAAPGKPAAHPDPYLLAHSIASQLVVDRHYALDFERRRVTLTSVGQSEALARFVPAQHAGLRRPWYLYVQQALQATHFFDRDREYVVRDDKIKLVDGNTGRVFDDRTWSDGLHQAVEAKEGITISEENSSVARISRQQYFRLYENLCGMTGTASDAKAELRSVYGLLTTPIQTHRPCRREVDSLRCFADAEAKWDAIARSVREIHATGRPILIGTRTIQESETIARRIDGLPFQLLNGKQDADEAQLIADAGKRVRSRSRPTWPDGGPTFVCSMLLPTSAGCM